MGKKKICSTRNDWAILMKVQIWNVWEPEITGGNWRQGEKVTSLANNELVSSGSPWPACSLSRDSLQVLPLHGDWWLMQNQNSDLQMNKYGQLFPLSYTACCKTLGVGVGIEGVCQAPGPSLLLCWATEHTGRSYFLFHLQSSPVGINWQHIKTPWGAFKKSGCPEPAPGPWTRFLRMRPSTLCFNF